MKSLSLTFPTCSNQHIERMGEQILHDTCVCVYKYIQYNIYIFIIIILIVIVISSTIIIVIIITMIIICAYKSFYH